MTQPNYNDPEYRRSRRAYIMECTFEYFVSLLVTDAFLVKLLSSIGFSDSLIGIIASFVSVAFLFQLFSVFVVQRITNTKRFVILFHSVSQLFFMGLYLIPFMPFAFPYKRILVIALILFAYFGNYFVTSILFRWGNSFVAPVNRAYFSAGKEMISLLAGMAVTLILGYVMDAFEENGSLEGGFLFAAVGILIFGLSDFICLLTIKNDKKEKEDLHIVPLRTVLKNTLGKKNFRNVLYLTVLWDVARYFCIGFVGVYRVNDLAFSVFFIQMINIAGNLCRAVVSKPFGRFSDKYSYATGVKVALGFSAVAFLSLMFTTPSTRWLVVVYSILMGISGAGTNSNLHNITYNYVESEFFVQASAIKNSIGGLCGFVSAILAGQLLAYIQENGNMIFGIHVYGQQVLAFVALCLLIVTILFVKLVIEKQRRMIQ